MLNIWLFDSGDRCQELILNPVWDTVFASDNELFFPRSSHKAVLLKESQVVWIFGGFFFNQKHLGSSGLDEAQTKHDLTVFHLNETRFEIVKVRTEQKPLPRYDHSLVYRKVHFFIIFNDT